MKTRSDASPRLPNFLEPMQANRRFHASRRLDLRHIPELIAAAGPEVTETYIDFFTSTIRNRNTRAAYARACWQFFEWCAAHGLELTTVRPYHMAAWIEDFPGSKPTIKLKLAAVRMLYDFLVVQAKHPSGVAKTPRRCWNQFPRILCPA
jgi:site-specific recombinase XerD